MRFSPVLGKHDSPGPVGLLLLVAVAALAGAGDAWAQAAPGPAGGALGPAITLSNASFEDVPRQASAPRGWYDCGFSNESPVDVHPASEVDTAAFFGVEQRAFDGNTYLGMVVRDNETYEAVSQRLNGGSLEAGKCYSFSVYLARAPNYVSLSRVSEEEVNYQTPAKLRIFGGFSYCNRGEVIAESAPVRNHEWLQYNFRFEPKRSHRFIVLEAYYKTPVLDPYNGNLLLDAAGKITPVACDDAQPEPPAEEVELLAEVPIAEQPVAERPVARAEVPTRRPPATPRPPRTKPAAKLTAAPAPEARLQGLTRADLKRGSVIRVEKLFFKADSTDVVAESLPVLDEIYDFLTANPDLVIEVGGHTNGRPPHEFCDWLSTERAESVVGYLVRRGIDANRLIAKGYGKRDPVATNKTPTGRRRNQRVEIKVVSIG